MQEGAEGVETGDCMNVRGREGYGGVGDHATSGREGRREGTETGKGLGRGSEGQGRQGEVRQQDNEIH